MNVHKQDFDMLVLSLLPYNANAQCLFCFVILQPEIVTLVHTLCDGAHIPAALMLQAPRAQQMCRYILMAD